MSEELGKHSKIKAGKNRADRKQKELKPAYGMYSCVWFMVKLAAKYEPLILVSGLAVTALAVVQNLANLFLSPMVLRAVEQKVSVGRLAATIGIFIGVLIISSGVSSYVSGVDRYRRITLRTIIAALLNNKAATTSYCNLYDEKFAFLEDKANLCTRNNSAATEAVWNTLFGLLRNVAGFIIYLFLLTNVEPVLLIVLLATTIPGYYLNKYVSGWGWRHREEEREIERGISCVTEEAGKIDAAKDIRIFGMRTWLDDMYRSSMRLLQAFRFREARVYLWSNIADLVLTFLRNGIAYLYLIRMVLDGGLTAAEFLLYFSAVGGFAGWVWGILSDFVNLHTQALSLSHVLECIRFPEPYLFEEGTPVPGEREIPGEIRLEDVSFRYPGAEEDTLKHVNLTLHPGERLAVVGLNGAGKTTLVKLICGLLDPTEGVITWNGADIRTLNRREYYTRFAAVFQESLLIPGSVALNVAVSEEGMDVKRVEQCIERAGLSEKTASLPQGMDTLLNRGVYDEAAELSGGQYQRLTLARALYREASVLLLDEPTSALDPIAESEMYQQYDRMAKGKSAVYISHRLASTRFCDRIILVENAGIAEEGTHDGLLAKGGRYAHLYGVQSRYYREDYQAEV